MEVRPVGQGESLREGLYKRIPDYLERIARTSFSLTLPPELLDRWKIVIRAVERVDDVIDNTGSEERQVFSRNVLNFLYSDDGVETDNDYLNDLKRVLDESPEDKEEFMKAAEELSSTTERLKTTPSLREFISLTKREGELTADLFITLMPKKLKTIPRVRRFASFMRAMARASNCLDAVLDIGSDYRDGHTRVNPGLRTRWNLVRENSSDIVTTLAVLAPSLTGHMAITLAKVGYRKLIKS